MTEFADLHVVAPFEEHKYTVILLHGRDSTAAEFASEFFESQASDYRTLPEIFPTVKWVFPTSKLRMSARFEMELSQWFDMWSVEKPQERNELQVDGLRESIFYLLSVLDHEASFVPPEQTFLGGISQGCATAIHVLMSNGIPLGGFIGLSSWLPFQEDIKCLVEPSTTSVTSLEDVKTPVEEVTRTLLELDTTDFSKRVLIDPIGGSKSWLDSDLALVEAVATPVILSHSKRQIKLCNSAMGRIHLSV